MRHQNRDWFPDEYVKSPLMRNHKSIFEAPISESRSPLSVQNGISKTDSNNAHAIRLGLRRDVSNDKINHFPSKEFATSAKIFSVSQA